MSLCWIFSDFTGSLILIPHDDVIKWNHFPRHWPFARGIHRSPVNSPQKGHWHGALMFSWIRAWINGWVNNGEAGDLSPNRAHYDVTVMQHLSTCHGVYFQVTTRDSLAIQRAIEFILGFSKTCRYMWCIFHISKSESNIGWIEQVRIYLLPTHKQCWSSL